MLRVEYEGVRPNIDHLAPSDQRAIVREVELHAPAGMCPLALPEISAEMDVTKQPELWPAVDRNHRRPGRLEVVDSTTSTTLDLGPPASPAESGAD